ncbi:MAG: dATP/dGTP pyrophosphohydrolase domain-containing protein [Thermodesulfobacteriota bacterium]|nr:dATP/dGTP pyrophosphohydrolase domain-containing protein [Thermodesulfobacteriota bacterium]
MDLIKHLERQIKFSRKAFGPGERSLGICDHISKELEEIKKNPTDLMEWIDVVILGFDGAWRAGYTEEEIANALVTKQGINESRSWPNWRDAEPGKAIEHIKEEKA